MIRGLILDYGEVLCNRPSPHVLERMASSTGIAPEVFAERYQQERGPYDRGDYSPEEYWSRVAAENIALDDGLLQSLRQWDVEMWSDLNPQMTGWLDELHGAGLKTAMLSNMHADMAAHVRRSFDWLQRLDYVVLSCELRLIKPDRAIYERCVAGLALQPSETCFIDDREINVQAAREAGLAALRFQTVEQLREDLTRLGIPVLPRANGASPCA